MRPLCSWPGFRQGDEVGNRRSLNELSTASASERVEAKTIRRSQRRLRSTFVASPLCPAGCRAGLGEDSVELLLERSERFTPSGYIEQAQNSRTARPGWISVGLRRPFIPHRHALHSFALLSTAATKSCERSCFSLERARGPRLPPAWLTGDLRMWCPVASNASRAAADPRMPKGALASLRLSWGKRMLSTRVPPPSWWAGPGRRNRRPVTPARPLHGAP